MENAPSDLCFLHVFIVRAHPKAASCSWVKDPQRVTGSARYPRLPGVVASPDADRRGVIGTTLEVGDSRPAVDNTEYSSPCDGLCIVLPSATKPAHSHHCECLQDAQECRIFVLWADPGRDPIRPPQYHQNKRVPCGGGGSGAGGGGKRGRGQRRWGGEREACRRSCRHARDSLETYANLQVGL